MYNSFFLTAFALLLNYSCNTGKTGYQPNTETFKSLKGTSVFQPDSVSIATSYKIPEWFRDAKFGIFINRGVYAVHAFGNEWYPRNMYTKDCREYQRHIEKHGSQTEFGYKDFIPIFNAEIVNFGNVKIVKISQSFF